MPPEQQQIQSTISNYNQLDPQAVNLAKAIRQIESNGNFQAVGKSGEYGAYQFMPQTWDALSKKFGVNVSLQNSTPEQQNEVAYKQIKQLKDQGMNVGQIASYWNSGNPNAYLNPNYKGINKFGASYDTPAYAKKVALAYQNFKNQGMVSGATQEGLPSKTQDFVTPPQITPITPPSDVVTSPFQKTKAISEANSNIGPGFIQEIASGNIKGAASAALRDVLPIAPDVYNLLTGQSKRTISQITSDGLLSALNVASFIPGVGEAVLGARGLGALAESGGLLEKVLSNPIGKELVMGSIYGGAAGGLGAISQGGGTQQALQGAGIGALAGGAIGGAGGALISKLNSLPTWLTRSAFKVDPETAAYALESKKPSLSIPGLLNQSISKTKEYNSAINDILSNKYKYDTGLGNQAIQKTLDNFPNAKILRPEVTPGIGVSGVDEAYQNQKALQKTSDVIKSIVQEQSDLVEKVLNGEATLAEKNKLKQSIDPLVYTSKIEGPKLTFKKQVAKEFSDQLRKEIKTQAPETAPLLDQFSKEIRLQKALNKISSKAPGNLISFRDLLSLGLGVGLAGIPGAALALGAEKLGTTPAGQFALAKGLRGLALPLTQSTIRGLIPLTTKSM